MPQEPSAFYCSITAWNEKLVCSNGCTPLSVFFEGYYKKLFQWVCGMFSSTEQSYLCFRQGSPPKERKKGGSSEGVLISTVIQRGLLIHHSSHGKAWRSAVRLLAGLPLNHVRNNDNINDVRNIICPHFKQLFAPWAGHTPWSFGLNGSLQRGCQRGCYENERGLGEVCSLDTCHQGLRNTGATGAMIQIFGCEL